MPRSRAIVVVAYGGIEYLQEALAPLADEDVIVVDNSSMEITRELVERLGHLYIDSGSNRGFSGGVNVGLREVARRGGAIDVLLLNPDAHIEPAAIDHLQDHLLEHADLAAVAPELITGDGDVQLTTYPLPAPRQMWRLALGLPQGGHQHDFVIGAALMLRAEALADVGEFDEHYFLYGEEADWQRRAFDRGWRVAVVSTARALHHVGMSSDGDHARLARVAAGQETYVRRWYGARSAASFRLAGWLAMTIRSRSRNWGSARFQARLFRLGPRRIVPLAPAPRPLEIVHVAWGVQGLADVATLASTQAAAGHAVTVLAGVAAPSAVESAGVEWQTTRTLPRVMRALQAGKSYDIVHTHGAASTSAACVVGAWHGTRVIASPDPAGRRRAGLAKVAATALRRRVDLDLPDLSVLEPAGDYRVAVAAGTRKRNIA